VVAREQPPPGELADLQVGFPLQALGDLLWDDLASEHAREAVTDDAFEAALEALHEAHSNPLHAYDSLRPIVSGSTGRDTAQFPCGTAPSAKPLFSAC
jgi:hypothetical protein